MNLADRLQGILDAKDMYQANLCKISGLSSSQVSQLLNGTIKNPRISTLAAISQALSVSIDYLVFGSIPNKAMAKLVEDFELLDEKGRMRLIEEAEILVDSGRFKRETRPLALGGSENADQAS